MWRRPTNEIQHHTTLNVKKVVGTVELAIFSASRLMEIKTALYKNRDYD